MVDDQFTSTRMFGFVAIRALESGMPTGEGKPCLGVIECSELPLFCGVASAATLFGHLFLELAGVHVLMAGFAAEARNVKETRAIACAHMTSCTGCRHMSARKWKTGATVGSN